MKILKNLLIVILSVVIIGVIYFVYGLYINPKSPSGQVEYAKDGTEINIRYYRPLKRDRLIFGTQDDGALVPFGQYWRLGANLTTRIAVNTDISFANRLLKKGSYGLYTYPYADHWMLFVHENDGGLSYNEPDSLGILMKINLPTETLENSIEQFTIDIIDQNIRMRWDTTQVLIPFE